MTAQDDAYSYLGLRVAIHSELVAAIIAGDEGRTTGAVEAHRGITVGAVPSGPEGALAAPVAP